MRPRLFYLTVIVVVACDQISKTLVTRHIPETGATIVEPFFSLTPTHNPGGAFSLLQAHNGVFITIAVLAIGALVYAYHTLRSRDSLMSASLALALGGAVGNLMDRAQFGYVRDFFHLHTVSGQTLWPIFNVADSAITVAILLLAYRAVRPAKPRACDDSGETSDDNPGVADLSN